MTLFNCLLGGLEMFLEGWPGFVSCGFVVPFADVAGENGGPSDNYDSEVD
jgi:hypothetical protein